MSNNDPQSLMRAAGKLVGIGVIACLAVAALLVVVPKDLELVVGVVGYSIVGAFLIVAAVVVGTRHRPDRMK
jgi:hypothetical protein